MTEQDAVASIKTKVMSGFYDTMERLSLGASATQLLNVSDRPIFLIPIICTRGADPLSTGKINEDLAIEIKAGERKVVNCSNYDRSDRNPNSKIRILFHAGSGTDSLKKFLENFCLKDLKEEERETIHPHNFLYEERELRLTVEEGKVRVKKNAGQDGEGEKKEQAKQTSASPVTETPKGCALEKLIKEVEQEVQVLKVQMEILKNFFKNIGSELEEAVR